MKRIAYTRPDGGLSIVTPAPNARRDGETEAEFIERIWAKDVPANATDVHVCADLPADRTYRDAWQSVSQTVTVNMAKARGIHMSRIRAARDKALAQRDIEFLRAVEAGSATDQERIAKLKQRLRDIPQTFNLAKAKTPEALKALWPSELKDVSE